MEVGPKCLHSNKHNGFIINFLFFADMSAFSSGNLQMRSWSYGCLSGTFPGFNVLPKLLLNHMNLPQIYGAFAALLFGKSDVHVPDGQVTVDLKWF